MDKRTLNSIHTLIEGLLYSKVDAFVNEVWKQEAANLFEGMLSEADPKPRVEKDHKGEPVIPSKEQLQQYFEGMASVHIQDQLKTAHDRWKAAADEAAKHNGSDSQEARLAAANLKTIDAEIEMAKSVLAAR